MGATSFEAMALSNCGAFVWLIGIALNEYSTASTWRTPVSAPSREVETGAERERLIAEGFDRSISDV